MCENCSECLKLKKIIEQYEKDKEQNSENLIIIDENEFKTCNQFTDKDKNLICQQDIAANYDKYSNKYSWLFTTVSMGSKVAKFFF